MGDQTGTPILKIETFGGLALHLGDQPLTALSSRKAQALLVYLARTGRSHAREVLAELLWFERAPDRALSNLRGVLHSLRAHLDPYLSISREQIAARTERIWIDANQMDQALGPLSQPGRSLTSEAAMQAAAALVLYQGPFLLGFPAGDSRGFEDWLSLERERLGRHALEALARLGDWYARQGEYPAAIDQIARLLALDPLLESAHRQRMRLLAYSNQRQAALAHYDTCRQVLADELGVEPEEETTGLYEQIRDGELKPPEIARPARPLDIQPHRPAFLDADGDPFVAPPAFVARQPELDRLTAALDRALAGEGQPLFIAGEAGAGKTALLEAFAQRAQTQHPDLLVAMGQCNIQSGLGDPYLPFRQVLAMLTGDVEAQWTAGRISRKHALRLWSALPLAVQSVLDEGPSLLGSFLAAGPLIARLASAAPDASGLLTRLQELDTRPVETGSDLERARYFEQYADTLQSLAAHRPLVILLDDLQWVDAASTNLLFHLGRNAAGTRILVLGAYRPDEVALGRPSAEAVQNERHPLQKTLDELKRTHGQIQIRLDLQGDHGLSFVNDLLDTESNQLPDDFRRTLAGHTGGHPLFTVELLRAMQERGDLQKDPAGRWVIGPSLDWESLPAQVEGVIEERIGRLEEELRDILTVASVEGEDFTAQVVARVQAIGERKLVHRLSRELDKRHRLVGERGTQTLGKQRLYLYRFRHSLFRNHLYAGLGEFEREMLHQDIGEVLEDLFGEQTAEIAPQLAWHFAAAGDSKRAARYGLQAGDQARLLYAHEDAIQHYDRALTIQKNAGDLEQAARTLMKLGLTYHNAFRFGRARQSYTEGFDLWQKAGKVQRETASMAAPHALRMDWRIGPRKLDPSYAVDIPTAGLIDQLFSGLVDLDPSMDIVPDTVNRWEILDGGHRYIFHLRKDVRWNDGVPLTAHDYELAWKRVLSPETDSPGAHLLYDIRGALAYHQGRERDPRHLGIRASDDHTLEIELEGPTSYFLQLLSYSTTFPIPRHVVEAHGAEWAEPENLVTNGPFLLDNWQPDKSLTLRRNPDYHRPFTGNLDRVEVFLISEPAARLEMYTSDLLDVLLLWGFPGPDLPAILRRHAGEYFSGPYLNTSYIILNTDRSPLNDARIRRALAHALDREALADIELAGSEFPATGGFVPPGLPGHNPGIALPYDLALAQELLVEAGVPEGRGLSALTALAPKGSDPVITYVYSQWEKNLNLRIDFQLVEWAEIFRRTQVDRPHLMWMGWAADYPDPDNFLRVAQAAGGWHTWQQEDYQKYVTEARRLTEHTKRLALYRKAERILVNEAPIIPLTYGRRHMLVKPWIRKLPASAIRFWYWKDTVIEPH